VIEGAKEADREKRIAEAEVSADGLLHTDGTEQVAAIVTGENKIVVESSLPTSMPPQRTGAWMALLLTATFRGKCAAPTKGLHRTKSLCGCQKATAVDCPDTGIVRKKPPCGGGSQGNGGGLSAKGKEKVFIEKKLIYRNGKAA